MNHEFALPQAASMPKPTHRDPRMPRVAESAGFIASMQHGWGDVDRSPNLPAGAAEAGARHRALLAEALPGETLVVGAGVAPVRANDTFYEFRADSDYLWLTGCPIQGAVYVRTPEGAETLYFQPPARPGDIDFFANAAHGELWVGPQPGLVEIEQATGIRTRPISEIDLPNNALIAGTHVGTPLQTALRSQRLHRVLAELRMIKDEWEIAELRVAVRNTEGGFAEVVRELPRAIESGGERWLQGTFDRHARLHGNGPGYTSIVGSGAHAPILHWVRADGPVLESDLLLLDLGIENRSGYTADVTRTIPAGGSFSETQRRVHDLVERSHRAGLAAVGPGRPWSDFHVASLEVIAEGLHDWGLLDVSVDEAMSPDGQQHRRFIVCGIGHHLGLDVHDCEGSSYEAYQGAIMRPGMALTVEPGLYFHSFDETVPPELRGLGVRIEDDLVVTETGYEMLSDGMPIDAAGIEAWMKQVTAH